MSTIWEMAEIIRAEEGRAQEARADAIRGNQIRTDEARTVADPARAAAQRRSQSVNIDAPRERAYWCKVFGTTPMNLCCAIDSVGREPGALRRFFESRPHPLQRAGHGRR